MKKRVVVGMSGGVDSSVAAYLLKEQGYEVIGVTMQIWPREEPWRIQEKGGCCGLSAAEDAARAADQIGIAHYVMNFREVFERRVIDYFVEEYEKGHTPNPCIACNRYVKWEALLERSLALGADYIATGHYARLLRLPSGRLTIQTAACSAKDQTYALYSLTQEQLARTLMPVGDYPKESIRRIAREQELAVADKPDSQEICFVPDGDYAGFIERRAGERLPGPGAFVDKTGKALGRHRGIIHYTVGQRRGLGLSMGERMFVTRIDREKNQVVVGAEEEVFSRELFCGQVNLMAAQELTEPLTVRVKVRYNHAGAEGRIERLPDGRVRCVFAEPVRAVTPGQAAVFYKEGYVLGGGVIL